MSARGADNGGPPPARTFNLRTIGPEPDRAKPLEEEDLLDLIPQFVATTDDLNLVEFDNITKALPWALDQARTGGAELVLDYTFRFVLHRRMFEDVWKWAGTQRRRVANIGVEPSQIAMQTKQTLDDATWWHHNNVFDVDERAARIHRRLVAVHPFPNGNGRCTRLSAVATSRPFTQLTATTMDHSLPSLRHEQQACSTSAPSILFAGLCTGPSSRRRQQTQLSTHGS
jgi:Fic-DOC domain mobile mystery protein B